MQVVDGHDRAFTSSAEFLRHAVIDQKATAIISYEHRIATLIASAAPSLGLRIPQDFSLICFNDVFPVEATVPPLTAVAIHGKEMGKTGADILLQTLAEEPARYPAVAREIRVPEELVVRASTAPART
jgi:LacI family transcriptional regulator